MHEASIAQALLDTAIAALPRPGVRITRVVIVAGPFSGIEKDSLTFYFTHLTKGTPAEGAVLEITSKPATLKCTNCGRTYSYDATTTINLSCPNCGSPTRLEGGSDLYLDSVDVEEP
jgi:hydrogenase nickel incorporation protein HypA/HybF